MELLELSNRVSVRARVGFALLVGRIALEKVGQSRARESCDAALAVVRDFLKKTGTTADAMYGHLTALFEAEDLAESEAEALAVCVVQSVIFYASWQAYRLELWAGVPHPNGVPNDIADGSERSILDLAEMAESAQVCERARMERIAERLAAGYPTSEINGLGDRIDVESAIDIT